MFNDDTQVQEDTLQDETSTVEEVEETTEPTEEAEEASEDQPDWQAEAQKWKAIAQRNKKKVETTNEAKPAPATQPANVEEVVLRAQGMDDDVLAQLKKVAKANNTDLITAQSDELFTAWKTKFEGEQKKQKAALGASKGSGSAPAKKSFSTPGLSAEEHRAMFNKAIGQ